MRSARNCAAPDAPCRMTTMSMRIASRFRAVSTSVSPFCTLEPVDATFTVSADNRFSANSNEIRVRVDASKNRLTIVAPRRVGTFLIARSLISLNGSAVSRMSWICSRESDSSPKRSLPNPGLTRLPPSLRGRRHRDRRARARAHRRDDRLEVVAIEGDVEGAAGNLRLLAIGDDGYNARRELDAAALNSDDHEVVGPLVQLENLIGHASQRSIDRTVLEQRGLCSSHGAR